MLVLPFGVCHAEVPGMLQPPPDFLGVSSPQGCVGMAVLQGWSGNMTSQALIEH